MGATAEARAELAERDVQRNVFHYVRTSQYYDQWKATSTELRVAASV